MEEWRSLSRIVAPGETEAVSGVLQYANDLAARTREIRVIDNSGVQHKFRVPEGMMDDIVRPLWGTMVTVRWRKVRRGRELIDIQPQEDRAE
jgi:hypothetical protein